MHEDVPYGSIARRQLLRDPGAKAAKAGTGMGVELSDKRARIDVKISRQVLWVGAEAYPLQNIARAQTIKLVPNRGAAFRRFLVSFIFEVVLGAAAAVAIRLAPRLTSVQASNDVHSVATGVLVLAVALVGYSAIRLIVRLSRGTYYALLIETAGTPRSVLVSDNENVVTKLVQEIMDAIDNPAATYHTIVDKIDLRGAQGVQLGSSGFQSNTFNVQ